MSNKGALYGLSFVMLMLLPLISFAQNQEDKQYKVIKGDTLWEISAKELSDPFLWPKIWKENPDISHPDRIYPGQSIRIPLYLLLKEKPSESVISKDAPAQQPSVADLPPVIVAEPLKASEPVSLKPLVSRNLLISAGYITDSIAGVGRVNGSPSGRNMFGINDIIYINTENPAKVGDRYFIIRTQKEVIHPATNKFIGYLVEIRGIAEVSQFEYGSTKARIVQMFDDIESGDNLEPYYEITPSPAPTVPRRPDISGSVIASRSLRLISGSFDIVYIDKGVKDGIEVGDVLRTLRVGTHKVPNSIIQVINLKDHTATAIIRTFSDTVTAGNAVVKAD